MRVIFDLEIHSRYARAVSRDMVPEKLAEWASIKGMKIIGTGDFTHPLWLKELKEKLEPAEPGLFKLKRPQLERAKETRFLLSGEISCVYTKSGKGRRVHHLVYAPSFEVVDKINARLSWIGNLKSDGRPIIGLDSKELLKILKEASPQAHLIPAHVWTPWFGVFGSKSGFDSLEECFDELAPEIFAVETGLSSDPKMNWRIPFLDDKAIVSGSDSHSLPRIGREATVFELENLSYQEIFNAIKTRDPARFKFTIEFFPEEGRYHYDGHRDEKHSQSPEETKKASGKCAKCGKSVTVGVMARVDELAAKDRPEGYRPKKPRIPFKNLVPLDQIIADSLGLTGSASKRVQDEYKKLIDSVESEFKIMFEATRSQLESVTKPEIAEGIIRVREGKVRIDPGYDGEYGKIKIFEEGEQKSISKQASLF